MRVPITSLLGHMSQPVNHQLREALGLYPWSDSRSRCSRHRTRYDPGSDRYRRHPGSARPGARNFVIVEESRLTAQMFAPSNATPVGPRPTEYVASTVPSEARIFATEAPSRFVTQMLRSIMATPNAPWVHPGHPKAEATEIVVMAVHHWLRAS